MNLALDAAYLVFAAVSAPWWLRKKRGAWAERFGNAPPLPPKTRPRVLIHAVSVGETNLIRALVDRLARDAEVVIASTTDTGAERARALFAGKARLVRYPLDASWSVRRFLDAVRPDAAAMVELELWPNFASECRARGIPLAIINGRLSDRSHRRYAMARPILGRAFAGLAFAAVQDETYAERFRAAGAPPDRVRIAGSMKWDAAAIEDNPRADPAAHALAREMGIDPSRPLIVAGSTAPDEHGLLHAATPPGAQLLCAPRRPEWFGPAAAAMPGCIRRTQNPRDERFLLDSIGELRAAYALADIVVIGRSFGELHGSDPMEPAGMGKPIVMGPAFADFRAAVDALEQAGGLARATRDTLPAILAGLVRDSAERERIGARARECVRAHQGATERHAELILGMLPRAPSRGTP